MPILNIDLMTPEGVLFEGNEIPDDLQSEELVSRLVNTLGLLRVTPSGEPIDYSLEIANQGVKLQGGQTLGEAGATSGDVIRLVASHKIEKPPESQPIEQPVADESLSREARTTGFQKKSYSDGMVLVIPVRGPNASVTKVIRNLKDGLGLKTEEISVLSAGKYASAKTRDAVALPQQQSVFKRHRTAVLAMMLVGSCLFLVFALGSKKKAAPVVQESVIAQVPTPEPTPDPTPEPTPDPTPELIPLPPPKVRARPAEVVSRARPKPHSVVSRAQPRPQPAVVTQNVAPEPTPQPKKCGFWGKVFVGCKDPKKPKGEQVGGVAGTAKSAAISNGKSAIRRGVTYPTRRAIP